MTRLAATAIAALALACSLAASQPAVPMRIALLVDTSDATKPAITQLRTAVDAFVAALPPDQEILFVSTGRHVQVRVPPTMDYSKVRKSAKGLLVDGGGTPLGDALREIDDRFMRGVEGRAPVFVVVTGDGSEISVRTDGAAFNAWLGTVMGRAVIHAVVIKTGNGIPEAIARSAAQVTHGQFETVGITGGVVEKLSALARSLSPK
jgi:hypothetical protein